MRCTLCTNTEAKEIYKQVWDEVDNLGLLKSCSIPSGYFSLKQMKSTEVLGRCENSRQCIMVNELLLGHPEALRSVMVHEIAHAITYLRYGMCGHDRLFYHIGNTLGKMWGITVSRCAGEEPVTKEIVQQMKLNAENRVTKIYYLVCQECGKKYGPFYRQCDKTKHPEWFRCGIDGGKLIVETVYNK